MVSRGARAKTVRVAETCTPSSPSAWCRAISAPDPAPTGGLLLARCDVPRIAHAARAMSSERGAVSHARIAAWPIMRGRCNNGVKRFVRSTTVPMPDCKTQESSFPCPPRAAQPPPDVGDRDSGEMKVSPRCVPLAACARPSVAQSRSLAAHAPSNVNDTLDRWLQADAHAPSWNSTAGGGRSVPAQALATSIWRGPCRRVSGHGGPGWGPARSP